MDPQVNWSRVAWALVMAAAGVAAYVVAMMVSNESPWRMDVLGAYLGMLLVAAGAALAAMSGPATARFSLWTAAGLALAAGALDRLLVLLGYRSGEESYAAFLLGHVSPLALYLAATAFLAFAMVTLADALALTYRRGRALGFVGLYFLLAALDAFSGVANHGGSLTGELELVRFSALILGTIQVIFLLLLARAARLRLAASGQ